MSNPDTLASTVLPPPSVTSQESLIENFMADLRNFVESFGSEDDIQGIASVALQDFLEASKEVLDLHRETPTGLDRDSVLASIAENSLFEASEEDKARGYQSFCDGCTADGDVEEDICVQLDKLNGQYQKFIADLGQQEAVRGAEWNGGNSAASRKRERQEDDVGRDADGDTEMGDDNALNDVQARPKRPRIARRTWQS